MPRNARKRAADAATVSAARSPTSTVEGDKATAVPRTRVTPRRGGPMTEEERAAAQEVFLAVFARSANVSQAAKRAHVNRNTIYEWLARDDVFRVRYEHADADAQDVLRQEAFRRAVIGVHEPLTNGQGLIYEMDVVLNDAGEPVLDDRGRPKLRRGKIATVKKYSDALLAKMLSARAPEYRDRRQVEVSGPNGAPIAAQVTSEQVLKIDLDGMSVAQLRALRAALRAGDVVDASDGSGDDDDSTAARATLAPGGG